MYAQGSLRTSRRVRSGGAAGQHVASGTVLVLVAIATAVQNPLRQRVRCPVLVEQEEVDAAGGREGQGGGAQVVAGVDAGVVEVDAAVQDDGDAVVLAVVGDHAGVAVGLDGDARGDPVDVGHAAVTEADTVGEVLPGEPLVGVGHPDVVGVDQRAEEARAEQCGYAADQAEPHEADGQVEVHGEEQSCERCGAEQADDDQHDVAGEGNVVAGGVQTAGGQQSCDAQHEAKQTKATGHSDSQCEI